MNTLGEDFCLVAGAGVTTAVVCYELASTLLQKLAIDLESVMSVEEVMREFEGADYLERMERQGVGGEGMKVVAQFAEGAMSVVKASELIYSSMFLVPVKNFVAD